MPWQPSKGVYLHYSTGSVELALNTNLRDYMHLTDHYFYPYDGQAYDNTSVDQKKFNDNFLENAIRWNRDTNFPEFYRDYVLNLEHASLVETSPTWDRDCEEHVNVLRMMRASGRPAYAYGIYTGPSEFQTWYNISRYEYRLDPELNPNFEDQEAHAIVSLATFKEQEKGVLANVKRLSDRFYSEIDAVVLSLYQPYDIPDLVGEAWHSHAGVIRKTASAYKSMFPGKPVYAFIQPNYVDDFAEFPQDVWEAVFTETYNCEDIDRIYVFRLSTSNKPVNYSNILVNGPA